MASFPTLLLQLLSTDRSLSTRREHDYVVQYRSLRIGRLCESTLLCSTIEEGRRSRAFCYRYALPVFAFQEDSLALGLLETVHAKGDVVLGNNYVQTCRHRFQHTGKVQGQWSRNRHGNGSDEAQDRFRRRKYHQSILDPQLAELLARALPRYT